MRKIFLILVMIAFPMNVFGQGFYGDVDKFQAYNPDVNKYNFVRAYLNALTYLKINEEREKRGLEDFSLTKKYEQALKEIEKDITNLRIAKNLLTNYLSSENKMIAKATDTFIIFCQGQVDLNGEEAGMINELFTAQKNGQMEDFNKSDFEQKRVSLNQRRRQSKDLLLESSTFVTKILVSGKADRFGQFVSLGITEKEREKLLKKINVFKGDEYVGEIKVGQSFLQTSVKMIRNMLEDSSWGALIQN